MGQQGISIKRTYTFYADTYKVDISDEVAGLPEYWISLGSDFGIYENDASSGTHIGPILLTGTDLKDLNPKKLNEPNIFKENLKWIAQVGKYFFSALVPSTPIDDAW